MDVLVVGAGITGLTTALALGRAGASVTVLELASGPRDGGYMIDFFGVGYEAADELGILADLGQCHRQIDRLVFFRSSSSRQFALTYEVMRARMFAGRHYNFLRGDLEEVLRRHAAEVADIRYGSTVVSLSQEASGVLVDTAEGVTGRYDLVVGADGVHSTVRELVWGPASLRSLRHMTAAYLIDRLPAGVAPDEFSTMTAPGRMVAVYPTSADQAATFFVHRTADPAAELERGAGEVLSEVYRPLGWVVPQLLDAAPAHGVYYDEVTQVALDRWVTGRVVLAGDAAWCVSLLAGQGASLGVAGGLSLANAITTGAGVDQGLRHWERKFRPVVEARQRSGRTTASWFVPTARWRMSVRDLALRTSSWPVIGRRLGRGFGGGRAAG